MTDRSQQTTGTTGKSQMDQDHEARVKMIIKDNEKGLVLLEYLRKKDKDEIRKLKKKYSEAAYIKSKLSKYSPKPDGMIQKINSLIDQFIRECQQWQSESKERGQDHSEDHSREENDGQGQPHSGASDDEEQKRQKSRRKSKKAKKPDDGEDEVMIGRHKKDQFALSHAEEVKRLEQAKSMMKEAQEKNRKSIVPSFPHHGSESREVGHHSESKSHHTDDKAKRSSHHKSKAEKHEEKRSPSKGKKQLAAEELVSSLVRSSPQKALFLIQEPEGSDEKKYKLVAEIVPSKEDISEILALVKGGHIERIDRASKMERDGLKASGKSETHKKKKRDGDDHTFPIHHYTKELISEGNFEDSFEEWIFDPIISSKAEYKETMMKSKKERELRENKKSQIEQKLKKVKTTDTFYMLNKKRFNLEPEGSNRPSSVHEKILQSRKQAYLARSVVLKDMSTNTDLPFHFAEAPGSHKHSKNIDHDENEEQNEQDFSSRDSSPGKDLPGKKLGVTRQDDYLAEMDDPDSRAGSAKPKPKKKELAHLHIQDINEIAHEQQWLKEEGAIPKKSATAKEAPAGPLIPKPPAPAMNPSYIKPNSSQNADLKPKVEPPKETPKKEEGIPPPVIDSKPVKPPTPPGAEPKEPAKDQKSPSEQLVESKDPVKTDEFPSPQASPKEAKPETPKAPEKTPDPPKPADVKPAPTMAKIPMPPTKKPADKPAETNTEVKAAPKPAPKPAEPPKDNPKEETKPTPPPDSESKPGEDQFGIPKLSQNPFLSRNAALKNASPDPKQKPDGKGQLTDSTLSPDKSKGGIGPLNPPKSPRSTAVDDKINGLRSLWK